MSAFERQLMERLEDYALRIVAELEETTYWLRLLSKTGLLAPARLELLLTETSELTAIFVASVRKLQQKP